MTMTPDAIWADYIKGTPLEQDRPDFRFDPVFYRAQYDDVPPDADAKAHFAQSGAGEGRDPNSYQRMRRVLPDLDDRLRGLTADPRLVTAIGQRQDGALELLFELIMLGDPFDRLSSDFSRDFYFDNYPELRDQGLHPFLHFIQHGLPEGRRSLRSLRAGYHRGGQAFDADKPTLLVCIHDCTRSGAPLVALDIVREAAEAGQNVVVAALEGGAILPDLCAHAVELYETSDPDLDLRYFDSQPLRAISRAIVNSVASYPFVKMLVRRRIPYASYLHEYPDYMRPAHACMFSALFSDITVFSAEGVRDAWGDILHNAGFDIARDSMILPQRSYRFGGVDTAAHSAARARLGELLGRDLTGKRIVLGAGHAQWRKGSDLFVLTAQMAAQRDPDTIFVWVGDGQNHEDVFFGAWFERHLREAGANLPGANLNILPAGDWYPDMLRAADAFYLSSRLDPLPNVVFDAAAQGCPTVLFRNASGFSDERYAGQDGLQVVGYGDLNAACDALLSVPLKAANSVTTQPTTDGPDLFAQIFDALEKRLATRGETVPGKGDYDLPVLFAARPEEAGARIAEREKLWTYGRRFVWPSMQAAQRELEASDNPVLASARIERFAWGDVAMPELSVHIHAHYTADLGGDLLYYRALREASRIVVTTDTELKLAQVAQISKEAGVAVEPLLMPNTGRDILPFLRLFHQGHADEAGVWAHVHQKKAAVSARSGEQWKRFLMAIVLGDNERLSPALGHITDPQVGLVAPFDPYQTGWAASRRLLPQIAPKLSLPLPPHPVVFPVGNMFLCRGAVAARMAKVFDAGYPWPNEPLPNDGTVYHLMERLWPVVTAETGLTSVFLDKPDQPRG